MQHILKRPRQDRVLKLLKIEGHELLEEYISLCLGPNAYKLKSKAYLALELRLKKNQTAHFGFMESREEVHNANERLRDMISEKRNIFENKEKSKFAPNLREVQREASKLNSNILAT